MTSAPAAAQPVRKINPSPVRRASIIVLITGTVLSVAAALGPILVARIGVIIAVVAGVAACALSWSELRRTRRQHAVEMLAATKAQNRLLRGERQHNAAVLDVLTARSHQAHAEIERQRGAIAQLRGEISSLHGDVAAQTSEIRQRESVITALRATVRAREAELTALRDDSAEVHPIPRRVLTEPDSIDRPAADELWADGTHPTVVDLAPIDPVALPNFEADRRLA